MPHHASNNVTITWFISLTIIKHYFCQTLFFTHSSLLHTRKHYFLLFSCQKNKIIVSRCSSVTIICKQLTVDEVGCISFGHAQMYYRHVYMYVMWLLESSLDIVIWNLIITGLYWRHVYLFDKHQGWTQEFSIVWVKNKRRAQPMC